VVKLPIRISHAERQRTEPAGENDLDQQAGELNLSGIRVLVVDDEADARELVQRLLTEFDATVTPAASMQEALEFFRMTPPNILLSDIGMPERDGYDLIRAVRALPEKQGGRIPAVALTALARPEDRKRAMLAGYQSHVAKPVDVSELVAVVASLTGRTGK
jgi:CheY-like chemotaxis protein